MRAYAYLTTCRCIRVASFLVITCSVSVLCVIFWYQNETASWLPRSTRPCPDVRRPPADSVRSNSWWQTQDSGDDKLVLYSAFYDDRPAVGATPWIRVLGVAKLAPRTHYCHVWYPEPHGPYVTSVVVSVIGRSWGYVIRGTKYVQYLLSCQLPGAEPVPSHVSVVADRCAASTVYLPVERPVRAEPDIEFGVCVAIAFGHIPTPVFVEWMELTWLLGVREFNVYDAGMVNMSGVFDHYTRRGWLRVHQMPPPVPLANHTEREVGFITDTTVLLLYWNLSGTTWVSRYQKGKTRKIKTNLDLLEQETVSGSGICWAMCNAYSLRPPARYPPAGDTWVHLP